jgi:cysteinyl-tRNA synthetase
MNPKKLRLFNTLGRKEMEFVPLEEGRVRLYTCGPTVYNYAHIGNLRTYIFEDVLRRTLARFDYQVHHVMNITDVGHLTSDADTGEDKMQVGARQTGRTVWEIARFYEEKFFEDTEELNIWPPHVKCRATEHIPDIIAFIERLLDKGYAYVAGGNVYFAVDRFPSYGELALLNLDQLIAGARIEVDENKANPYDFVLWFTESKFPHQVMKWPSPWGVGFPGWHIECSVMATKYLGERLDIHCGGIDHIPVHHTNEIAQSEAALGHGWVNYWLHGDFLVLKKGKMSKSAGKFLTLSELPKQGFSALDYRYFCLGTHYRRNLEFSWEALQGAQNALSNLRNFYLDWLEQPESARTTRAEGYREEFDTALMQDLNAPQALATAWKMARDPELEPGEKRSLLLDFDQVLGLGVEDWQKEELPSDLQELLALRQQARASRDFARADELRAQLLEANIGVKDTPTGPQWYYLTKKARKRKEQ